MVFKDEIKQPQAGPAMNRSSNRPRGHLCPIPQHKASWSALLPPQSAEFFLPFSKGKLAPSPLQRQGDANLGLSKNFFRETENNLCLTSSSVDHLLDLLPHEPLFILLLVASSSLLPPGQSLPLGCRHGGSPNKNLKCTW